MLSNHIKDVRIPQQDENKKSAIAYLELANEPSYEVSCILPSIFPSYHSLVLAIMFFKYDTESAFAMFFVLFLIHLTVSYVVVLLLLAKFVFGNRWRPVHWN